MRVCKLFLPCYHQEFAKLQRCYEEMITILGISWMVYDTPFTRSKNYLDRKLDCNLDRDPEDVPVNTGHSLFNITKCITLLFIVQSLLHRNPPNIYNLD